jgi:dihydroxy-acid dehydratase
MADYSGRRIVDMVWEDLKPRDILTRKSFDNAIRVLMALGGSTNGLIHVIAMAGRAGIDIPLERFEEIGQKTPYLVNMRPSGKYLMEDFYYAGGLSAMLEGMRKLLDIDELTCTGKTLGENIAGSKIYIDDVIRTPENPMQPEGGLIVLARQSRARWRRHQVDSRGPEAAEARRTRHGVRRLQRHGGAHRQRRPRR